MKTILTLTMNSTIDVSTGIAHVVPERKLRCRVPRHEAGGGGINVARAIRKLGDQSTALYTAGGPPGEILKKILSDEQLEHQPLSIAGWTRESVIVREDSSDRQFRFGMPGPEVQEKEWRHALDAVRNHDPFPDFVALSGSLPPGVPADFCARIAAIVRDRGSRLLLDTSGEPLRIAVDQGVFLIKPNRREFGQLVGQDLDSEEQQNEAATDLVKSGKVRALVLSLGAAGVLAVDAQGLERIHPPSVKFRSAIGAGDSMLAGIVVGLARGLSWHDTLRLGVAAGTAAVMTPGTELCRREDAERLYRQLKTDCPEL